MPRTADIQKLPHHYLPTAYVLTDWASIESFFKELLERPITNVETLEKWLLDLSELEAFISEDACWRQIKMTCDTTDKSLEEAFNYFCMEIQPKMQPYADALNKKLINCPYTKELNQELYFTYLRSVKKNIELFREENIPIQAELSVLQQQYGTIAGKMTISFREQEYTLQQAAQFLEDADRGVREEVYRKVCERRLQDQDSLHDLFTNLVQKRNQIALNAGFANYRDYKFVELGRFDYSKEDCFQFHEAIKLHVLPLIDKIYARKKKKLGLATLKPWDTEAEPAGTQPLRPFTDGKDLFEKSVTCFEQLNPFFADCLKKMNELKHFDLESRKGKAPGGYNCPLAESGAPFIFMNASGNLRDVETLVHEAGHAIHSFQMAPLTLNAYKNTPSEVAELASMSMELLTMNTWDAYFDDKNLLNRAKSEQLEGILGTLPWIAQVDAFQHWIYENPTHNDAERTAKWLELCSRYGSGEVDYTDLETALENSWHKQLHIFEVPFYYVEYGFAQLGAVGVWKNYITKGQAAIEDYKAFLKLGNTKSIPNIYETAGVKFEFSESYISDLMQFVQVELAAIHN